MSLLKFSSNASAIICRLASSHVARANDRALQPAKSGARSVVEWRLFLWRVRRHNRQLQRGDVECNRARSKRRAAKPRGIVERFLRRSHLLQRLGPLYLM